MLQTRTCVTAHCDQCGATPDTDEYEPHWPTENDALEAAEAAEWYTEDLPRLLCAGCHAVLSCEGTGHEFTGWRRCRCAQRVPAHPPGPGGLCGTQFRCCRRCGVHESRPAPDHEPSEHTVAGDLHVDDDRASWALTDAGHGALAATGVTAWGAR